MRSQLVVRRAAAIFWVDVAILAGALVTFATGLVLFVDFHIDDGVRATAALGVGRLTWLNVHRLCALVVLGGTVAHVALHWRAFLARLRSFARARRSIAELLLYLAFPVTTLAGFVAWLVIAGSTPLDGPVTLGELPAGRHPWVDVHNLSGLVALVVTVIHLARRARPLARLGARATAGGPPGPVRVAFCGRAALLVLARLVTDTVAAYDHVARVEPARGGKRGCVAAGAAGARTRARATSRSAES
jgi:hypothetical protein